MWPNFVVPREVKAKLESQIDLSQRHDDSAGAFGFQGADHAFHHGNGAVFSDGAEAGLDFPLLAPFLETSVRKEALQCFSLTTRSDFLILVLS